MMASIGKNIPSLSSGNHPRVATVLASQLYTTVIIRPPSRMFYEDSNPITHHVAATSNDGVHFTVQGTLTTIGLNPDNPEPTWGDMAYDPTSGYWYAIYNSPIRDPTTTGGEAERGSYGVTLYKIPNDSLLTGSTPWQELHTIDTNMTVYESNHLAAFV